MLRAAGHLQAQEQHRHGAGCGHERTEPAAEAQPAVQRSAVHDILRTSGRPLDDATRTDMESRLGADFSDVRIHDDAAAKASAAELGARAYTSGSHVVIGDGGADDHTLAHELTHVVQQRRGPVAGTDNGQGLRISDPTDRHEREAEANATRVMARPSRRSATASPAAPRESSAGGSIQRMPARFGVNNTDNMAPQQWQSSGQSTFLSIMYKTDDGDLIDLAVTKSNQSQTHGNEHAEDVALRMIRDNLGMFAPGQRNHLVLNVTKSPCTSTARGALPTTSNKPTGCAEELIGLVTAGLQAAGNQYDFDLELICRGLYAPQVPGQSQADVLDASQAAVEAMKATGHITVSGDVRPASSANRFEVRD
ncbi:DUF4157 domain-containing protein [Streptomyces sp. NPDC052077]|uniref:eCIS core domain-containing protein n=1 Tax=Streptomyces sp. NPDC052077 TaxID=3154757 RepID=UPI00344955FC